MKETVPKIAVIGGGAAGLMAAGRAAEVGADVTVYERNDIVGKKLLITGKGRCNLINRCDVTTFISNIPTNPRFMYTAISSFTPVDIMNFFESRGLRLKTERGNRVFPVSDKSADVVMTLKKYCSDGNVRFIHRRVTDIVAEGGSVVGIKAPTSEKYDAVILATGGASYPSTGSTGDGYRFCRKLGIRVSPPLPSLVPLEIYEPECALMQGLSLKNVGVKAFDESGELVYEDFGELMFTHFGMTGPTVLSMSAYLKDADKRRYTVSIDLKPALDAGVLDKRVLSDFSDNLNRDFGNSLSGLLPSKMIAPFVSMTGIPYTKKVNSITKSERAAIVGLLKDMRFTVKRTRPVREAIVTSGGVDVSEINPRTMESKKIKGLFFAGEVIDVDAYTGGFNLGIAFSTARLAAENAALIKR